MNDLVRNLREEAQRLSGFSIDRGSVDAGISANLADRAADVIEEFGAKEIFWDRTHKTMTAEIEKFQRNLRHWREECGKLHAQLAKARADLQTWEITALRIAEAEHEQQTKCSDCPPAGYPTDMTRCTECPERYHP